MEQVLVTIAQELTPSQVAFLKGGARPGTFFRDLQGVSNQVPRYVWLLGGATCLGGAAYLVYKQRKGKKGRRR
jgi:hypothetical protein